VIAATHVDLQEAVQQGKFREDLFYRLNVINIHIPPLRNRIEDIPLLAKGFVERLAHELGKNITDVSESGLKKLMEHPWPGNVRELENAIERAMVTCKERVLSENDFQFLNGPKAKDLSLPPMTLADLEREAIIAMLKRTEGNVKEAASRLGIDRSTLYDKIKYYNIPR
jgi:two-component system, NtrC family, response regulator HydG